MIPLLLKFLVGGLVVVAVDRLANLGHGKVASLIAVMPALTLAAYLVIGFSQPREQVAAIILGSAAFLPATLIYLLTVWAAVVYTGAPIWAALLIGVAVFFLSGWLISLIMPV